jgi:two-component system cell cycle response regulator DivK
MSGEPRTILVVDDDADVLEIHQRLLRANGYRVVCVARAGDALHSVYKEHPVLVLLDLAMPDVSGLAFARALRADADWNAVPIVAVSALGEPAAEEALTAGCTVFLSKPVQGRTLLDVINRILGQSKDAPNVQGESGARS